MDADNCKACRESVRLSGEEMERMFGTLRAKDDLADEETYRKRLAACSECDALWYGTTCRHCGCVVQIKARFLDSDCPYPYAPKW